MTSSLLTVKCGGPGVRCDYETLFIEPTLVPLDNWIDNTSNQLTPSRCYQDLFNSEYRHTETLKDHAIMYVHDDVTFHEPNWRERVMTLFECNPRIVCVGLGGAIALGNRNLYKSRYRINNLARQGYVSNQTDWQVHGGHETGAKRVAVVDAFFMAVRASFLSEVGGWPVEHLTHHCLDLWLACEAARRGKEVWMVGASCTHHGGGSSTKPAYEQAWWLQGGTLESDHQIPHRWLYEEYRDVLPIEVRS